MILIFFILYLLSLAYVTSGHGGSEAATFAKEHLINLIVNQKLFWSNDDRDVLRAIREGYIATHYAMWREQGKLSVSPYTVYEQKKKNSIVRLAQCVVLSACMMKSIYTSEKPLWMSKANGVMIG